MRSGPAASTPMPPAFDTAMTSAEFEDAQLIAAWKLGCSMPRSAVIRVFTAASSFERLLDVNQRARLAGDFRERLLEHLHLALREAIADHLVALGCRADQSLIDAPPELAQRE